MAEKQGVQLEAWTLHGIEGAPVQLRVEPTAGGRLSFSGFKEGCARATSIRVCSALETGTVRLDDGAALRVSIDREEWSGTELDLCAAVALAAYAGRLDP